MFIIKYTLGFWLLLTMAIIPMTTSAQSRETLHQEAMGLFQEAHFQALGVGDIEKAIELFENILTDYPQFEKVQVESLLAIARYYEHLDNQTAAKMYYQLVIDQFQGFPAYEDQARGAIKRLKESSKNED